MPKRKTYESIADLWKEIIASETPQVYLFELKRFPELENTPSLFKTILEFMDGYFVNHLKPTGILDFKEECDFRFAESFSRTLGLGGNQGLRGFKFKREEFESKIQIVSYLVDYENTEENSVVSNVQRVADLNQPSTSLLASMLASPIIGQSLDKDILGLLFEEHIIDFAKLDKLFQYFTELKKRNGYEDLRIYLLVVSERLGRNELYYSTSIQRVGILKEAFMKVNPYEACVRRFETISGGIRKGVPFVLFLGAGASAGSDPKSGGILPLGDDLKKIAIRIGVLRKPELKNATLEELEEKFKDWLCSSRKLISAIGETRENVTVTLERVLREELSLVHPSNSNTLKTLRDLCDKAQPPIGYTDVKRIIEMSYHPIVITTNYDLMLERVLKDSVIYRRRTDFTGKEADLLSYLRGEKKDIPILKIHGSLDDPDSILQSVKSTHKLPGEISELMHSIYSGEINKQIGGTAIQTFFAGYSLRDQDVRDFFSYHEISKNMKPYVVNPSPSPETVDFYVKNGRSMAEYLDTLISLPFSIFTKILLDQLNIER